MRRHEPHGLGIGLLERQEIPEPRREHGRIRRRTRPALRDADFPALAPDALPHRIGFLRIRKPRRKEVVAQEPFEERHVLCVTPRRRLQQFVNRAGGQHLRP